jgi:predicted ATP-dependent endonuclease of OLD family
MDNKMNTSNIKSFSVYGLFGTDDIHIPFDENIKILVGENGIGKTQVLNLFYYTLTRNFFRLDEFSFDQLILEFDDRNPIKIDKASVNELTKGIYDNPIVKEFINEYGYSEFEMLRTRVKGNRKKLEMELEYNPYFRKYPKTHITINHLFRVFEQENTLIQFGMDDVKKRFTQIESKIDKLLKEGFSKFTSEILSQLVKGFAHTDNNFLSNINENDIEIILARVGKELSENDKNEIINSVKNQSFENPSLTYILKKLVEIYDKQKELDDLVKKFKDLPL